MANLRQHNVSTSHKRVAKRATYVSANSSSHVLKGELVAAAFKPEDAI